MGPCKPKTITKPRVILNDPTLQEHKDHMENYAIICKFMGIWPSERTLCHWIRQQWKPRGDVKLHLGAKGFFTVVFSNLEDKDRIFWGGSILFSFSWPVHATMETKLRPRERIFYSSPSLDSFVLSPNRLLGSKCLETNWTSWEHSSRPRKQHYKRDTHLMPESVLKWTFPGHCMRGSSWNIGTRIIFRP